MEIKDEEKRLRLENKKLAREVKRLTQDIALLRVANDQAVYTQAYIQRKTDRQMLYIEQLMRTAPNIFILTDEQLRTVMASDLYFRYSHTYDKSAIRRGAPLEDALSGVFSQPDTEAIMQKCRAALLGEDITPYILYTTDGTGGRKCWRVSLRRMTKDDEIVGMNLLFADTTEIVDAMERAEAADKAKSSFLANMSHEIRTPINAMLGLNEMILRESSEAETRQYATDIQNAGRTLLSLVNDILDFSKVEEGKMEILPAQYDLASLINDLVNMSRGRAEEKGLRFEVHVDKDLPQILVGDEIRIRQCALNILTNAVKYTARGSVTLSVDYESSGENKILLRIRVTDTGMGLKPEDLKRMFEPFTRVDETRNRSIEGTGLGMAITKELLALMGGQLEAESVYGEGSKFGFVLEQPVVKWAPIGEFAGRLETADTQRAVYHESFRAPDARVLVVDDMPVNLTVVKGLLKKTQIQVDTAESGWKAIDMLSRQDYDVAFIDHMMPEIDGVETLRVLKGLPQAAGTVFIALTANAISGSREKYIELGFQDYLSKPVDSAKMEEMLMKYLPPSKLLAPEAKLDGAADGTDAELPDGLRRIEELDMPRGLKNCGSGEMYLKTLEIYAQTAAAGADEIEGYRRTGALADVVTKVHALKSTSRVIGASALGALAEKLEFAGKAGDNDTLLGGLGELLARYRALGQQLLPLVAQKEKEEGSLPAITEERLREAYAMIRRRVQAFEYDRAATLLDELGGCRLPEGERERFDALRRAAAEFEWEKLDELLGAAAH